MTITYMIAITEKELAVLITAMMLAAGISIAPFLGAEAQSVIPGGSVLGLIDQSNVEQTTVQVLNQEACTNESGEQSNDCEVDQTQSATSRTGHDTSKSIINNIR
jgi:hypothetical protein